MVGLQILISSLINCKKSLSVLIIIFSFFNTVVEIYAITSSASTLSIDKTEIGNKESSQNQNKDITQKSTTDNKE